MPKYRGTVPIAGAIHVTFELEDGASEEAIEEAAIDAANQTMHSWPLEGWECTDTGRTGELIELEAYDALAEGNVLHVPYNLLGVEEQP